MGISYGISIATTLLVFVALLLCNSYWFGLSGGNNSIQLSSRRIFADVPYLLSWQQLLPIIIVLGILGNLAVVSMVMLISKVLKKAYAGLLALLFGFILWFFFCGKLGAGLFADSRIIQGIREVGNLLPIYSVYWNQLLAYRHDSLNIPSYLLACLFAVLVTVICGWAYYIKHAESTVSG